MIKINMLIGVLLVIYITTNYALSGGYIDMKAANYFLNNYSDEYALSLFQTHSAASGISPAAQLILKGNAQIGKDIPTLTDLNANLTVNNSYYSRMASFMEYKSGKIGQASSNTSLNVETFLVMPKEFDSFHSENITISEDGKKAKIELFFKYDGVDYEFTNETELAEGANSLMIVLQPFCKEFEGTVLYDDVNKVGESISTNGLDISGYLTIQGKQG
jgi:hypothetical protein